MSTDAQKKFMLKEAERFFKFANSAVKMTDEIGSVISTDEAVMSPAKIDRQSSGVRRLSNMKDMRFFTLGPVYVAATIPFDIIEDFKAKVGYDGPRLLLKFDHSIVEGIGGWSNLLEGIHSSAFDDLTRFISTQVVIRRQTKEFWASVYQDLSILDPYAVDSKSLVTADSLASIRVFLPCGNKYRLSVSPVSSPETIQLRRDPALVSRLKEAKIALVPVA